MNVVVDEILFDILSEQARQPDNQCIRIFTPHPFFQLIPVVAIRVQPLGHDFRVLIRAGRRLKYIYGRNKDQPLRLNPANIVLGLLDPCHVLLRRRIRQILLRAKPGINQKLWPRSIRFLDVLRIVEAVERCLRADIATDKACIANQCFLHVSLLVSNLPYFVTIQSPFAKSLLQSFPFACRQIQDEG